MNYYKVTVLYRGKKEELPIKAETKKEAISKAKLKKSGVIVRVEEASPPLEDVLQELSYSISNLFQAKGIKRRELIATIRQLAVMTNAGIPLYDALKEIAKSTTNKRLQYILEDIADNINAGISLTQAMEKYVNELGTLTLAMVRLGEQTGDIGKALFTLANILEQIDENVRKFKKAMRYPLITIGAMALAFVILISFVVPKFKAIFDKFHAELPLPTKILLTLEHLFNTYGLYILAFGAIGIFLVYYLYKTNHEFKRVMDGVLLRLYLVKDIIYYAQLSRFMLVFSELIKAGIPVIEALDNSLSMVENEVIKEKLQVVKQMIEKGSSIEEAFKETGLFENMILQMIKAGDASGQLDLMLEKIAQYYDMRFNYILDNLSAYIEPIMLVLIAAMVLLLALGIFLPIWDMSKVILGG
ncbi:MAG: type II secretion system F family protein [Epsilonproteobacteria bacterium]|nr:type II secretion system F family protein [Campylobacterota bacterium]